MKNYEMGYTIAEFAKTLHSQFLTKEISYACQDISSTHWVISVADQLKVDISISQAPARIIGMLSLPVLNVEFKFTTINSNENYINNKASDDKQEFENQTVFLKRFFKYFHKGGG